MTRPFVGLAVLALALGVATPPAAGAAPERYTFEFVDSDTIDCSSFDPAWTFNHDFVDFLEGRGQVWLDAAGQPIRAIEHIVHRSNDVRSTSCSDPAPAASSSPRATRSSISKPERPFVLAGPDRADDEDFCRAVAP